MSSELIIDNSQNDEEIYRQLAKQFEHLIDPKDKISSTLSNFTAVLKQRFNKNLWGVLDVDSYNPSAFNKIDKYYLEQFCKLLVSRLELNKFALV